jgi:hypothetical protein
MIHKRGNRNGSGKNMRMEEDGEGDITVYDPQFRDTAYTDTMPARLDATTPSRTPMCRSYCHTTAVESSDPRSGWA